MIDKTKISKIKCSELSGHYIFSSKEFKIIKQKASEILSKKGIDLDLIIYTKTLSSELHQKRQIFCGKRLEICRGECSDASVQLRGFFLRE